MSNNTYVRATGGVTRASLASENETFDLTPDGEEDAIGDREALRRAFADPRYQSSASYRAMVADCIARSQVVAAPQQSFESAGRFQVRGNPIDEAPPVERELTPHDLEMIAKAEKHGL
jgi:hypothetical protein